MSPFFGIVGGLAKVPALKFAAVFDETIYKADLSPNPSESLELLRREIDPIFSRVALRVKSRKVFCWGRSN